MGLFGYLEPFWPLRIRDPAEPSSGNTRPETRCAAHLVAHKESANPVNLGPISRALLFGGICELSICKQPVFGYVNGHTVTHTPTTFSSGELTITMLYSYHITVETRTLHEHSKLKISTTQTRYIASSILVHDTYIGTVLIGNTSSPPPDSGSLDTRHTS